MFASPASSSFARLSLALTACISAAFLAGCGGNDLPSLADIQSAPEPIRTAARAVVRIKTSGSYGTGSFISSTGLLLTNNHVLGAPVCPVEGCKVEISALHQKGIAPSKPALVLAVPVAVSVGLDMAVVQILDAGSGTKLTTPDYLSVTPRKPEELLGMHVTVVGHPEGRLKKWSDGVVVDLSGEWIMTSAFILPGNSGSPLLDDEGHIVGLMHRAPTGEDLITDVGYNADSIGTASAPLVAAMKQPLPEVMISTKAATTAEDVASTDVVYLNGGAASVSITGGTEVSVLSLLATACDAALARNDFISPDDLTSALGPCVHALSWIECRSDVIGTYPTSCPEDTSTWTIRFQKMNQLWVAMNGSAYLYPVSFGAASLAKTHGEGLQSGANGLEAALNVANAQLDPGVANYLAAFAVPVYRNVVIADYVRGYRSLPHYEIFGTSITSAALWLGNNELMSRDEWVQITSQLHDDAHVSVGTKLYIEDAWYESGVSP